MRRIEAIARGRLVELGYPAELVNLVDLSRLPDKETKEWLKAPEEWDAALQNTMGLPAHVYARYESSIAAASPMLAYAWVGPALKELAKILIGVGIGVGVNEVLTRSTYSLDHCHEELLADLKDDECAKITVTRNGGTLPGDDPGSLDITRTNNGRGCPR